MADTMLESSEQPTTPEAPSSATSALGAPTSSLGTPQPAQPNAAPVAPRPTQPSPTQQAAAMQNAHHSALGRLASYLLGSQTQYVANPQSGQVEQVAVKQKPGDLFRAITAGALMGMAAGSQARDFAGGVGVGGAAVMQQRQAQDQQRYARAQQQLQNQREQQTIDEARKTRDAQIAQQNANNIRLDWEMGLQTQKTIDEHNDRERAFQLQLDQAGATPMQIQVGDEDINGQEGNGAALQKVAGQDLDAVKAPDGYHTLHTMEVDTNGLQFRGGQWVDENGQPVNIESRTKHTLYQLPDNVWNRPADGIRTGDDLNKLLGFRAVDPNAAIHMTVGDVMAARAKGQEVQLKKSQSGLDDAKARKTLTANRIKPSDDPDVNAVVSNLLSSKATGDQIEATLGNSQLTDEQKNEARGMLKKLAPAKPKSAVDDAIEKLSSGSAKPTAPPGKSVVYDPSGASHYVNSGQLQQFLADPAYKGWHQ